MRNVITILVCVVCLSAPPSAALAQSQLGAGSISGTVSDSNGAAISGATVTSDCGATVTSDCSTIEDSRAFSTTSRSKATTTIRPTFPKRAGARALPATSAPTRFSSSRSRNRPGPVNFDTNLVAPAFTRVYQFPDGPTLEVPFAAGLTRTAAGAARNVNLSRPNPNFGSINVQRSIGETYYKALFLEVKRRFSGGLQFNIAYTLAKAENLSGTGNGGGSGAEDPFGGSSLFNQFDLKANRAPAPTDQRHRFVVNGVWNLPELKQGSALARGLLNGYRLSGIFTAESGRPFAATLSLPNIPFTLDGAQYTGFGGILGLGGLNLAPDVPRNSNYGDVNYRIDLRVARDVKLGDKFVVELLGEAFNLFNRSNFNGFNSTLYNAAFPLLPGSTTDRFSATNPPPLATPIPLTRSANFGAPNNDGSQPDGTNARRFQLALRFRF